MGIIRADGMFIIPLSKAPEIGRAVMAHRFQREFGQPLLNFRALDLEQTRFRPRTLAGIRSGQTAEFGKFQRGQINFQIGDLAPEKRIGEEWPVAILFRPGDALDLLDAALGGGHARNPGAFMGEEEFGTGPALILT